TPSKNHTTTSYTTPLDLTQRRRPEEPTAWIAAHRCPPLVAVLVAGCSCRSAARKSRFRVGLRHGRTDVIERLIDVDVLPPGAAERGVARQHLIANADNLQAGPISQCSYRSK